MSEERECHPTDGLIDLEDEECKLCGKIYRDTCKIFSIQNGLRDLDYFLTHTVPEPEPTNSSLLEKLKKMKKG